MASRVLSPSPSRSSAEQLYGVRFTHPDRVVYQDQGITKRDLADYYASVAEWMLPHLVDRPLSLVRCPGGMKGPCFYQKQPPTGLPASVNRMTIRFKEGNSTGVFVKDLAGLLTLVQFGCLELHAWLSRADQIERPDRIIFDLDPGEDVEWARVTSASIAMRDLLSELSLTSFVKTTGGKGLHIVVPLARRHSWPEVKQFAKAVSSVLAASDPSSYTLTMSKAARPGKIFIDYLRNERGATAVVAYSTRARTGAPVSMPLSWKELRRSAGPAAFTIKDSPARLKRRKVDPWAELTQIKQTISPAAKKQLQLT